MEVDDDSQDSLEDFDVKPIENIPQIYNESSSPFKQNGKFQIQVLSHILHENINNKRNTFKIFLISIPVILCAYYLRLYISSSFANFDTKILLGDIMNDLRQNVLHQDNALYKISNHLRCLELENCSHDKVLAFIGGTGVGKTFTSEIIKKYIPNTFTYSSNHVLFYKSDQHNELTKSLAINNCSFIMFDNVQLSSVLTLSKFLKSLPEKCVLVVLIFNVQDTDDLEIFTVNWKQSIDIVQSFFQQNIFIEPVKFNAVDESVIRRWLPIQLKKWGFDESKHNSIIEDILQSHNIRYFGFKGIQAKVKLMKRY